MIVKAISLKILYKRITNPIFSFSTIEQVRNKAKILNVLDSLTLDQLCRIYQVDFGKFPNQQVIRKFSQVLQSKSLENSSQSQQYLKSLELIHNHFDKFQIGFLRGDLHSTSIYKIEQYLQKKMDEQNMKQLAKQDYIKILNLITDTKTLRLPFHGIKIRQLQSKKNLFNRQLLLQQISSEQAFQKFYSILESLKRLNKLNLLGVVRKQVIQWLPPMCQAIKDQQQKCKLKELTQSRRQYGQYLIQLKAEQIASIALSSAIKQIFNAYFHITQQTQLEQSNQYSLNITGILMKKLIVIIGKHINGQIVYQKQQTRFYQCQKQYDKLKQTYKFNQQKLKTNKKDDIEIEALFNHKKKMYAQFQNLKLKYKYIKPQNRKQYLLDMSSNFMNCNHNQVPDYIQHKIGELLVLIIKDVIKVKNRYNFKVPLFSTEYQYSKKNNKIVSSVILKVNQNFLQTIVPELEKQNDLIMHMDRSLPTIIQPLPWLQYEIGGYYLQPTMIVRFSQCSLQERCVKFADLSRVFSVLNFLGSIPWKINHKVLQIVEKIWQEGGNIGSIPKRYSQVMNTITSQIKLERNYKNKKHLYQKIQALRDQHSLRSSFLFKLNIARSYSKLDRFFFPHNLDFRGRVYPIPPHLNHIGDDLSRGLLTFADGKKLGTNGLKWLKIHCANLMGKDKSIIEEKIKYVNHNLDYIRKIAEQPLKYRDWLEFEDCWQAIAAMIQLNQALKLKKPQQYVSHIHVHQDGSCNGLQHYAALGRDKEGAQQVNLDVRDLPGDVYTYVASMVIKQMQLDVKNTSSRQHELASKLIGNIKRKTIKQTVMTSVYGVTFIGAKQQIIKQLRAQNFLTQNQVVDASIYIARLTLKSIKNLFNSAHHIKQWLINSAKLIGKSGNPVSWLTPAGLPVVQPYRKSNKIDVIQTIDNTLKTHVDSQNLPVDRVKQASAFPPNFVHSLDSTHMIYTAERCKQKGIYFSSVHDSFWTHASDVDDMNILLREEFVRLHSQPLLETLKKSFQLRYPNIIFPKIPTKGSFNLENVKKSTYFFS